VTRNAEALNPPVLVEAVVTMFQREFEPKLGKRAPTFRAILDYLLLHRRAPWTIVETGSARQEGNFDGDGMSTMLWSRLFEIGAARKVISLECDRKACELARKLAPHVEVRETDSVKGLEAMTRPDPARGIDLLYLDSFDLNPSDPWPSAFHHMMELATVWSDLPSGALVVVDDCINDLVGKHVLVAHFMKQLNVPTVFTGYQTGWARP
jgi:predicted O-methyltransferase YrrM